MIHCRPVNCEDMKEVQLLALMHHDHYASQTYLDDRAYFRFKEEFAILANYQSFLKQLQIDNPNYVSFYSIKDEIIGFSILKESHEGRDDAGYISVIYVHYLYRQKGYGKIILNICENILAQTGCHSLWLNTRTNNEANMNFYRQQEGWIEKGINHKKPWLTIWEKRLGEIEG